MKVRENCHLASCKFSKGTFCIGVCLSHSMTENMAFYLQEWIIDIAEYPTMSANNKGELKFLERKPVKDKVYRPMEDIVNGSILIVSVSTVLYLNICQH